MYNYSFTGVYYQKCHDPDCKSIDYKSPEWTLPKNTLPSYFMEGELEEGRPGPSISMQSSPCRRSTYTVPGALTQEDFDKYFDVSDQEMLIAASQYEVCQYF